MSASAVINPSALSAVMRRQLWSLLGNPLGYVFILAFVLVSGATLFLFQGDKFFARNISDLSPLFGLMPLFLAVLLPALAMGSWASEREQGTEELLLTLPLSIVDAVVAKWLAVVVYFTIALACSLSNVVVLSWLGTPDWGLVISNYAGWWIAGLVFAALGVLASVVVGLPAIAFVLGIVLSGITLFAMGWGSSTGVDWFDAFDRGVIPAGNVGAALAVVIGALGIAMFLLASRRWRPSSKAQVWQQALSLVFGLLLLANLARLAGRFGVDADVTSEGLASISATGANILKDVAAPVTVTAFISAELPNELQLKGKEVADKLKALERVRPGLITVRILRPKDALDSAGALAGREFNLKPRKQVIDTVAGKEPADVFLGAAVTAGGNTQLIDYFDPGLSVEYELVRAVKAVAVAKKKVLGIASTDLDINGGFDYQGGGMIPSWEIVNEWKKQYEVREVNLDSAVVAEIDALVVPQPSTLTQPQIENLHGYIWAGRPALLLEDPMPFFSAQQGRSDLIPGQPKKGGNPMQGPDAGGPQKGNIAALYHGLGLDFDLSQVLWSDFNPSHEFRGVIPPEFVWAFRDQQSIRESAITTGISSLLIPFPGQILEARDKPASLTVKPLFGPTPNVTWGRNPISEMTTQSPYGGGGLQFKEAKHLFSGERANPPAIAVEITGTMNAAYPVADPNAKPAEAKDGKPAAAPEKKTGIPSAKPVNVIVIADVDFLNNEFFGFYRNSNGRFNEDNLKFLLNLRNVQLAANAVDSLFADAAFLELRTKRAEPRPLKRLEDQQLATRAVVRQAEQSAEAEAQSAIDAAQKVFNDELAKIDARQDIDENAKAHEKAGVQVREQRKLNLSMEEINEKKEGKLRDAKSAQRDAIDTYRTKVKQLAIGIPAAVLAFLVLAVFLRKVAAETAHVPTARKRSA